MSVPYHMSESRYFDQCKISRRGSSWQTHLIGCGLSTRISIWMRTSPKYKCKRQFKSYLNKILIKDNNQNCLASVNIQKTNIHFANQNFNYILIYQQQYQYIINEYFMLRRHSFVNEKSEIKHQRIQSDLKNNNLTHRFEQQYQKYIGSSQMSRYQYSNTEKQHTALLDLIKQKAQSQKLSKLEKIRINQWTQKLTACPHNAIWSKNVIFYLQVLSIMLDQSKITQPFMSLPPQGSLLKLTVNDLPFPLRKYFQSSSDRSKSNRQRSSMCKQKRKQNIIQFTEQFDKKTYMIDDDLSSIIKKEDTFRLQEAINYQILDVSQLNIQQISKNIGTGGKSKCRYSSYKSSAKRNIQEKKLQNNKAAFPSNKQLQIYTCDRNKQNQRLNANMNNQNTSNVSRKLFNSKEHSIGNSSYNKNESSIQLINKSQYIMYNTSRYQNQLQKTFLSSDLVKIQDIELIKRIIRVLEYNSSGLAKQQKYQSLYSQLIEIMKKQSPNDSFFQEAFLDTSQLSQQSKTLIKTNQKIKKKFSQTDKETAQFLAFLKAIKNEN